MKQDVITDFQGYNGMREFLKIIFRRKGIVILTLLMVLLAVSFGLEIKTPTYEARVTMLIQAQKNVSSPYYEDLRDSDTGALTATQSEIVKSNPVIERAVRRLRLIEARKDYEKEFASPLKVFLMEVKGKIEDSFSSGMASEPSDAVQFRQAVESLKQRITVAPIRDTNLFTISVTDYSPTMAARIANMVSRSYSIFDLEQQLAEMKQKYGEKHLFVKQLKDNISAIEDETYSVTVSNVDAIGPASVKVIEQATVPIDPQGISDSLVLTAAFMMGLIAGGIAAYFAESNDPTVRSPRDVSSSSHFIGFIPRRERLSIGFLKMLRIVTVLLAVGIVLSSALLFLGEWADVDTNNRVFVSARSFTDSVAGYFLLGSFSTSNKIAYYFVLVIALSVAVIVTKAASFLIRRLRGRTALLKHAAQNTLPAKSYSDLSDELFRLVHASKKKSVVIARSSSLGSGSMILANLGISLSQRKGYKVLLIDAHLHKPSLGGLFKVYTKQGLSHLLHMEGESAISSREVLPGLSVLPAGESFGDADALLRSSAMAHVLRRVEKDYDIILVHCAGVSESQDIIYLAPHTAGAVLIVDELRTKRDTLKAQVDSLQKKEISLLGVILNDRTFVIPKALYERT